MITPHRFKTKDGKLSLEKLVHKQRYFNAKGEIKTISEDFRSFTLFVRPEGLSGLRAQKNGTILKILINRNNRVMLRYWIKVGDIVSLKLFYKVYYSGDDQISETHFINFN